RRAVILVGFLILAVLLSASLKMWTLEKRKAFLSGEIRHTFQKTFPQTRRIVDEIKQARNYLNARNAGMVEGNRAGEADLLDVIRTISTAIPDSTFFQIANLYWERGKMEISGKTDSFKTVNSIQEMLSGNRSFSSVTISNAKLSNEGQNVEFQISIRIER
ncbi:MAG: PilN domain-containing protein, partial [Deltaproteobacteria bacterium]|nr:PilN domain-containing protein [Deltaproteobacteria bacterium]